MRSRKINDGLIFQRGALGLAALAVLFLMRAATAATVTVQLRNGDRLTGELLAQETNHIVIATSWAGPLAVPIASIGGLRAASGENLLPPPGAAARPEPALATHSKPATPKTPKRQRASLQLGSNLMYGARDTEALFARLTASYEKPYDYDPKKFFRTSADYSADYGETENVRSANRMTGSVKTDFDLGPRSYCYNVGSGGYDEIRKIDLHYEVGPGLGYHLLKRPAFVFNVEGGLNYQAQHRSAGDRQDSVYLRAGEDTTWRLGPRLSVSESFEFFMNSEAPEQFRFRLDATVSYKLVENLSLHLTLLDLFDTDPAPKVNENELQIRSAIGITF